MQSRQNSGPQGFSLIEIMVATAILAIIVLVMSSIFTRAAWPGTVAFARRKAT